MNAPARIEEAEDLAQVQKSLSKFDKSIGPSGAPRRRYRTIWISDVHLGTRGCNDRLLIDFLDHVDSETHVSGRRHHRRLAAEEDAITGPTAHNDDRLAHPQARQARHPGRLHPRQSRRDVPPVRGAEFRRRRDPREAIHNTADGRRLLVLHGDEFDAVMLAHRWLAFLGDAALRI